MLWSLAVERKSGVVQEENPADTIYFTQARIIRELAEKEICVIAGRCSDYILRNWDDCLHIFICVDRPSRAKRILGHCEDNGKPVEKRMDDKDAQRKIYYTHYTDRVWGAPENYYAVLNSGTLGEGACVQTILGLFSRL